MGAYLHLRGLAELDEVLNSNKETLDFSDDLTPGPSETISKRTSAALNSIGGINEGDDASTKYVDDCSRFWAGQFDDVSEALEPQNRNNDAATANSANRDSCANRLDDQNQDGASTSGRILGEVEESASTHSCCRGSYEDLEDQSERLPDHLLIELLVRVPTRDWPAAACVKKRWAQLFRGDGLWHSALLKKWPGATSTKRWPGPIARGSSKRRYTALYVSDSLFAKDRVEGVNEVAGHVYLFLKEQLESPNPPVSYGLLHGTIIDQFLACCKTGDEAHNLASHVWIAVLDNLDESENTFHLLMRIAEEWEVLLPYPYSKSHAVQWRLFERLFTDFRDCLSQYNYFDVLTRARSKFEMIPQTWLGY